jgi:hypothetical protein
MGTTNFFKKHAMPSSGLNLEARAIGANAYGARSSGTAAGKDIAAAQAIYKANKMKPTSKTAATAAPGPKKV